MKIDKIIFTSSEEYSGYWNLNSKVCKEFLGIEPICFLFGKKKNTDMNEQYGEVIEKEFLPNIPKLLQITWHKFFHTKSEPETTWMIGDIDQIPLQRKLFIDDIQSIPDDHYVHLNSAYICQLTSKPNNAWETTGGNIRGGADLAGHYHVAKGKIFEKCLQFRSTLEEDIQHIVKEQKYGLGITHPGWNQGDPEKLYWCGEENYSSEVLYTTIIQQKINPFTGLYFNLTDDTIDRWRMIGNDYLCDREKLKNHKYVNIHGARDYKAQEQSLINILKFAKII